MGSEGGLKMLVVDDQPDIVDLLKLYFSKRGYEVLEASTGIEAIKKIEENPDLDVVLLDIMLPDMTGVEILEQIRPALPDTVIIMVTAVNDLDTVIRAMKHGADDYAVKPFRLGELEEKIESALAKKSIANLEEGMNAEEALRRLDMIEHRNGILTFVFDDVNELNKFTDKIKEREDVSIIDIRIGENYEVSLKKT